MATPAPTLQEFVTNAYHTLTAPPEFHWGILTAALVLAALLGTAFCALAEVIYARASAARPETGPEPGPTADGKLTDA